MSCEQSESEMWHRGKKGLQHTGGMSVSGQAMKVLQGQKALSSYSAGYLAMTRTA
jgi:hypothetical protein